MTCRSEIQIATEHRRNDPISKLHVSAPIEKSFVFLALLEETDGIVFCLLIGALLFIWRARMLMSVAMPTQLLVTILATKFGELTLFSIGGRGFLFWLFIRMSAYDRGRLVADKSNLAVPRWHKL